MCKGPLDKAKVGNDSGWKVGVGGEGKSSGGKMEKLYLNNNKKKLCVLSKPKPSKANSIRF